MRWIVGLDTRDLCQGAIAFAAWLREHVAGPGDEFLGIHILDRDAVASVLGRVDNDLEQIQARAKEVIDDTVRATRNVNPLSRVDAMTDATPEEGLAKVAADLAAAGVIIGRRAGRVDGSMVRLGRTGRRLLRQLPLPVLVVPPDLEAKDVGDGPVLCAVDLDDKSVAAATMAAELARVLGRRLRILHVSKLPETLNYYRGDQRLRQDLLDDLRRDTTRSLEQWCEAYALADSVREVIVGDPAMVVHERAEALRSPLVVCGSRRLSLSSRLFTSSMGSYLAATLPIPLLLVPPSNDEAVAV